MNMTNMIPHNYYPPTIHLPHYAANETSVLSLIAQFGFLWAAALGIAFIVIQRVRPAVSRSDQLSFIWMCLSTLPNRTDTESVLTNMEINSGIHSSVL
jgi:cholestenol delta-isomerase